MSYVNNPIRQLCFILFIDDFAQLAFEGKRGEALPGERKNEGGLLHFFTLFRDRLFNTTKNKWWES